MKKNRKNSGITLIALIITIIVMLILASVSINAIIGDNGIITNSQNANMKSGMTALEQWLQEKYVEYYDDADNYASKPLLLNAKIKNLLLPDGTRNYVVNGTDIYYLINKSSLPKEISDGLIGGNTSISEYGKYIRLRDVYGVTEDLKVYYCDENGKNTYGEMVVSKLDSNTPAVQINSDSGMKSAVEDALSKIGIIVNSETGITVSNIGNLKNFEIDGSKYSINSLSSLSEISTIKNLTLKNLTLSNLIGIEHNINLDYIYLENCKIDNYGALAGIYSLNKLYIYLPSVMEKEEANNQIYYLGTALNTASNIKKLQYFGIFGRDLTNNTWAWDDWKGVEKNDNISKLTDISGCSLFHDNIKETIQYIYLNDINVESISALTGFESVIGLECVGDLSLTSLNGISKNIEYLYCNYCSISDTEDLKMCKDLSDINIMANKLSNLNDLVNCRNLVNLKASYNLITDISGIGNLKNLSYIFLESNSGLVNLNGLENLNQILVNGQELAVSEVYLYGCSSLINANGIKNIIKKCGTKYSLPSGVKLLTASKYNWTQYYSNTTADLYNKLYSDLYGNLDVTNLTLNNCTAITNDNFETILSSMTSLTHLYLKGCTTISSDLWALNLDKLQLLDLQGCTSLSLLTNLETAADAKDYPIHSLLLNNSNIILSNYQKLLNKVCSNYVYNGSNYGLCISNADLVKKLSSCTQLKSLKQYGYDFATNVEIDLTKCNQLTQISGKFNNTVTILCPASLQTWGGENNAIPDFSLCTNLNSYSCSWCSFSKENFQEIINSMANIKNNFTFTLSASSKIISEEGDSIIDFSPLSTSGVTSINFTAGGGGLLNEFYLSEKYYDEIGDEIIGTFSSLKSLSLSGIKDLNKVTIKNINNNQSFSITISSCPVLNNGIELENLNSLKTLAISNICGMNSLGFIDSFSNILSLQITDTNISNIDALSTCNKDIQKIWLYNNNISDLSVLENIISNETTKLQILNLSRKYNQKCF